MHPELLHQPDDAFLAANRSVFARMLDSFFGENAGFKSTKHCISKDKVHFDINQCPYCKYLTEIGCPEIIRFSCDVDKYIYGNLPGLERLEQAHPAVTSA